MSWITKSTACFIFEVFSGPVVSLFKLSNSCRGKRFETGSAGEPDPMEGSGMMSVIKLASHTQICGGSEYAHGLKGTVEVCGEYGSACWRVKGREMVAATLASSRRLLRPFCGPFIVPDCVASVRVRLYGSLPAGIAGRGKLPGNGASKVQTQGAGRPREVQTPLAVAAGGENSRGGSDAVRHGNMVVYSGSTS